MGRNQGSWLAASVFFLSGCLLVAVPSVVRSMLFAALWGAKTSFDHSVVENQVPTFLYWIAGGAFALTVLALTAGQFTAYLQKTRSAPKG